MSNQSSISSSWKILATQLDNAQAMPFGVPRTKSTQDVVTQARTLGYEKLEMSAQLELIGCYLNSKNTGKALEIFSQCLSALLRRPGLYTKKHLNILGHYYPLICQAACSHPDIPLSLIGPLMAGMDAFLSTTAPSEATASFLRHQLRIVLGQEKAQDTFLQQAIKQVDSRDSRALRRAIDIAQIEAKGHAHPEECLKLAHKMLTHELPASQRAHLLRAILVPLVRTGAWQEAWEAHLVAYQYDVHGQRVSTLGPHLRYLCEIGAWKRIVKLLSRHLTCIRHAKDPWDLLQILQVLVATLEILELAGYGSVTINTSVAGISRWLPLPALKRPTVSQASVQLGQSLHELKQRFDTRNGVTDLNSFRSSAPLFESFQVPESWSWQESLIDESDTRVLEKILRVRAFLECEQAFDALLILDTLKASKFPGVKKLWPQLELLTSWARMQVRQNPAEIERKK